MDPGTGHRWWWVREEARIVEKKLLEEHGTVVRWNGSLGVHSISDSSICGPHTDIIMQEERLWIADPKAIHHILQSSNHLYEKPYINRELAMPSMGRGLIWAGGGFSLISYVVLPPTLNLGDVHKRQRRAMTPAFGLVEAKALYPYFSRCSNSVSCCPNYACHSI